MAYRKSGVTVLRLASLLLTDALVASSPVTTLADAVVTLETRYVPDDGGDGIELFPEVSMDGGTTWSAAASALDTGTPSSGGVTVGVTAITYAHGPGTRVWSIDVPGAAQFRVQVRETGSIVAAGTCQVRVVTSRQES